MIKKLLRYVRQQPKPVRNRYALVLSSTFTAFVALIYLISGSSQGEQAASVAQTESNLPFSTFINQAKDQWNTVRGQINSTTTNPDTETQSGQGEDMESDPRVMTLSEETIEEAGSSERFTSGAYSTNTVETKETNYVEVQIATTSTIVATSSAITP